MNAFLQIVWQHPLLELIGWTLVHSLWQGSIIATGLAMALRSIKSGSAALRYNVACGALLLMVCCALATFSWLVAHCDASRWQVVMAEMAKQTDPTTDVQVFENSRSDVALADMATDELALGSKQSSERTPSQGAETEFLVAQKTPIESSFSFAAWMPLLTIVWLLGISILSLRMLGGLWKINRWRRRGNEMSDAQILETIQRLSQKLSFNWKIRCLESLDVCVPTVLGFWRPVLLVPLGMMSGLTISELESILAHELAHIRRRDWLVNLMQTVVETLLFYHPAVWWMSSIIRTERENCCDDIAVSVCGDRLALAKALTRLEESRSPETGLALAASGGQLLHRVRRILSPNEPIPSAKWPIGLLGIVSLAVLYGGLWLSVVTAAPRFDLQHESRTDNIELIDTRPADPVVDPVDEIVKVIRREESRITLATIDSPAATESHDDLTRRVDPTQKRLTIAQALVSSEEVNYVLGTDETFYGVDARQLIFSLPNGSGVRVEISGHDIQIRHGESGTKLTIVNGRIKLIDAGGVVRAEASPDGGAELLFIDVEENNGEIKLTMSTAFQDPTNDHRPPLQAKLTVVTGAAEEEKLPPHGATRYRILHGLSPGDRSMKMESVRFYDADRLRQELESRDQQMETTENNQADREHGFDKTEENPDDTEWGQLAEISGLQSRLTLQTARPQIGQPLLVKLELRNSGDKPTDFDPQKYAPFRVLRVDVPRPDLPPPYIGLTPQTSGQPETLQPGETKVLWENVDVSELFLLNEEREYQIFAEGGEWAMQNIWRDSNRLRVTLHDGTLSPRQELMVALLEIKPADWKLSVGISEIYLQHAPTNLKKDAISATIRFTQEELPEDFEVNLRTPGEDRVFTKATIDYLGETTLGHAYLISLPRHTEALWPNYLDNIVGAMKSD